MWWKRGLWGVGGFVLGIAVMAMPIYLFFSEAADMNTQDVPARWSSAGKEWPDFADWLRHGGRKLIMGSALAAAKDGMNETGVRKVFGPPDLVVVGNDEFAFYSVAQMKGLGAAGAYFYKVGAFAYAPEKIINDVFAIIFDAKGKVVYRMGFSAGDGDKLADLNADTRSDRRVAP